MQYAPATPRMLSADISITTGLTMRLSKTWSASMLDSWEAANSSGGLQLSLFRDRFMCGGDSNARSARINGYRARASGKVGEREAKVDVAACGRGLRCQMVALRDAAKPRKTQ
jgi:hypothetical protein